MKIAFAIIFMCLVNLIYGQEQNPVQWRIHSNKTGDRRYELHFSAIIASPWHIYAQQNDSDGAMPTSISFKKNPAVELMGKAREIGDLKVDSVLETVVQYYENEVDFVQTIRLKSTAKTTVSGTISWMACAQQCLPEAERHFNLTVGGN
jgi:hypothetical protein